MKRRWLVLLVVAGLLLSGPPDARADLFEDSLAALTNDNLDAARFDRFISEKELTERHALPVLQAILADARERQQASGGMMIAAGVDTATTDNQFGAQHPMGYGY